MKLFSRIIGEGQSLLIVHGLFGMSDNWQRLGKEFADFYEVHLIDQRNHGRSPHSEVFNYDLMTADLVEYIQDHDLSNVLLMGHSLGGKTVMELAVKHPDLIEKLIVVDISPKTYGVHHDKIITGLQSLDFDVLKSRGEAERKLAEYIADARVRQFLLKSLYWVEKGKLAFRFKLDAIAEQITEVGKALSTHTVYEGPCLFIAGANSEYILDEDEDLILSHFPEAEIVTITDAGHWVHAEQPKRFFDEVLRFCVSG